MNKMKKLVSILLALVMVFSLTACGTDKKKNGDVTQQPEKTQGAEETSEPVEATPQADATEEPETNQTTYPLTIKDSYEQEVVIEKEPTKIVSCGPNITELIYALEAQDKLVGRTDYCDYPAEVTAIESIGTMYTPDIEKITSLEPDLVIASTHFKEENLKKLQDLGIPIIELYDAEQMDGVYSIIETIGNILNKTSQATTLISEMKKEVEDVTTKVSNQEAPTVYYAMTYGENGNYTAGGNTFINEMIELAGGDNIAKDLEGWEYSLESLLEKDPDIILVGHSVDEFKALDAYKELTAVKEDRVYAIDVNLLERQGYRNAEGVHTMAKIFHKEVFE